MAFNLGLRRPLIVQQFRTFAFAVGISPLPIESNVDKTQLVTTFIISNPIASGVSIFFGNQGVTPTTGLEIFPGAAPVFSLDQEGRQLYEVQGPVLDIDSGLQCRNIQPEAIPFIVWDPSSIYLVATAPVTVSIALFKAMYL
jgi:hypothetical protein